MGSFTLLLLFFLLHLIAAVIFPAAAHQLELWANDCSDENGNYTSNSTYKSNLDKLLTKISNTDIPYGFYNFSSGEDPDQINALALCRGDINITECHTCLDFLISRLTSLCSIQMDAIGWAEKCMLRYSPASILGGAWEESPYHNLVTGDVVTVDVDHYQNVVEGLLRTLPNKTAGGDSQLKFATGEAQGNASRKVYALMQCTPDLPTTDCLGCLYWAMYYALRPDKGQTGARILVPSCTVRYESYKFFVASPPQATTAALPPSPAKSGTESDKSKIMIIVVLGVLACLSLLVNYFVCCCLRRRPIRSMMLPKLNDAEEAGRIESLKMDFTTIRDATQKFSEANLLGSGGFGVVYKGTLDCGQQIAVKRLVSSSRQSDDEFENEVRLAAKLQHRNLVKLLGFCLQRDERLLIFEFVSNGSLDKFLFDAEKRVQLDWGKRFIIIEGIARGLLYLHEDSRYKIVHRDMKAANVLLVVLDDDLRPQISDFGTSRLFLSNVTHDVTERAAGTRAYMAPEYSLQGLFSFKSDVYSFGILVLEIVAGRRNIGPAPTSGETWETLVNSVSLIWKNYFISNKKRNGLAVKMCLVLLRAWRNWIEGKVSNIIDPTIVSIASLSQVTRCIQIAFLCIQESAESRPTMYSVNQMLAGQSSDLPPPSQLADTGYSLLQSKSLVSLGSSIDIYPR